MVLDSDVRGGVTVDNSVIDIDSRYVRKGGRNEKERWGGREGEKGRAGGRERRGGKEKDGEEIGAQLGSGSDGVTVGGELHGMGVGLGEGERDEQEIYKSFQSKGLLTCMAEVVALVKAREEDSQRHTHYVEGILQQSMAQVLRLYPLSSLFAAHTRHCSTLQRTATHCNTLSRTATHCNTLQHTLTQCNTHSHAHAYTHNGPG